MKIDTLGLRLGAVCCPGHGLGPYWLGDQRATPLAPAGLQALTEPEMEIAPVSATDWWPEPIVDLCPNWTSLLELLFDGWSFGESTEVPA